VTASIGVADHLINKAAVAGEIGEVAAATQKQCLPQRSLEMSMRPFDRAVLMRQATIVARRCSARS
jgi:hypothetical protein